MVLNLIKVGNLLEHGREYEVSDSLTYMFSSMISCTRFGVLIILICNSNITWPSLVDYSLFYHFSW